MGKGRKTESAAPAPEVKPWKHWVTLLAGALLASAATLIASHYDLGRSAELDFKGARAQGAADAFPGGGYRLSYTHPSGVRYGMLYKKPLSKQGETHLTMEIAYLPDDPQKFQPAGLSYLPGGIALTLFGAGMACILRARRQLTKAFRARSVKPSS